MIADVEAGSAAAQRTAMRAVTHLRNPSQRESEDTRLLLSAGLDIIKRGWRHRTSDGQQVIRFEWPTKDDVIREFNRRNNREATRGLFDARWRTGGDYAADLLAWSLDEAQWGAHYAVSQRAATAATSGVPASRWARDIARQDLDALLTATSFRIKLMVCGLADPDPKIKAVLADFYDASVQWWSNVYVETLAVAGRRLRPDVSSCTFAMWMTALEEGLSVRYLANPDSFTDDVDGLAEALALGALAMFIGASSTDERPAPLGDYSDAQMYPKHLWGATAARGGEQH
jgi:hypothetical protein